MLCLNSIDEKKPARDLSYLVAVYEAAMSRLRPRRDLRASIQRQSRLHRLRVIFKREEGFFVGAIMANVVATEVWILIVYFACLLLTNFGDQTTLTILFLVGVTFPLLFYHHSWSLWLGLDHLIEGLPEGVTRERRNW